MLVDAITELHEHRADDATRAVYQDALRATLKLGDFVTIDRNHWKLAIVVGESHTGKVRVCIYSACGDWWTQPRLYPLDEIVPIDLNEYEAKSPNPKGARKRHRAVIAKAKASIARNGGAVTYRPNLKGGGVSTIERVTIEPIEPVAAAASSPPPAQPTRGVDFGVMSVPGNRDDGSDTSWFVLDFRKENTPQHSTLIGTGDAARIRATRRARTLNREAVSHKHPLPAIAEPAPAPAPPTVTAPDRGSTMRALYNAHVKPLPFGSKNETHWKGPCEAKVPAAIADLVSNAMDFMGSLVDDRRDLPGGLVRLYSDGYWAHGF